MTAAVVSGTTEGVAFLQALGERGREPLWAKVSGHVRVELHEEGGIDCWVVAIDHGEVSVSQGGGRGDCTIRADRRLFDRLCRGEENAIAAMLRGALVCTGDVELLYAMQRIFPGPARTSRPRDAGRGR
jgi:putative sterol carrier protein